MTSRTALAHLRGLYDIAPLMCTRNARWPPQLPAPPKPTHLRGPHIVIFTTGGTIDKVYFDAKGGYEVGATMVRQVLDHARVGKRATVVELLRKDSLQMTAADRETIRRAIARSKHLRIVVTHGTDTIVETARTLNEIPAKTIVLTGALQPARFASSDASFNLGMAVSAAQILPAGTFIVANGGVHCWNRVRKNSRLNRFEEVDSAN